MSAELLPARLRRLTRVAALAAVPVAFGACDWFTDFKEQPKVDPWESASDTMPYRGNPQGSVPVTGARVPGFAVSYAPLPATLDSMRALTNPLAADARSLDNGRKYYQINCAPCHGPAALGNGPATRYGVPSIMLVTPQARGYPDGYLYGIIRNGRGMMPPYNRIEESDRWDLINYLRALQSGAATLPTNVIGFPGQTGNFVPGPSTTAPTRPVPHAQLPAIPAGPPTAPTPGTANAGPAPARPPATPHTP